MADDASDDGQLEILREKLKEEREKVRDVDGIAAYVNQGRRAPVRRCVSFARPSLQDYFWK